MTTLVIGSEVQDIQRRDKRGVVLAIGPRMGGREMIKVRWSDGKVETVPLTRLELYREREDVRSLLLRRAFGGAEDFSRNYTLRKLLTPVDDTLYTLHASRTKLLPHQFKPLIKFLDSIHRRFLVADEVGLGKTIEAGIILSELRARGQLRSVLIFCPNHLRSKWANEMQHRFDERFRIISARRDWAHLMEQAEEQGLDGQRVIVGHKTLASRAVREQLSDGAPHFNLIIVDEAHHFKNSETIGRQVLRDLADSTDQLLLLTATPLQTRSDNLLSLLRLLDVPAFRDRELFDARLQANAHIVRAERALRETRHDAASIRAALHEASAELERTGDRLRRRFGLDANGTIQKLRARAENGRSLGVADIIELSGEVRELNLLSPYITRTRKVEVQQTCKRRVESVRPADLTAAEKEFYRVTVDWFREEVERRHGEQSVLFLSRTFERRLSSSFHGFARYLLSGAYRKAAASILSLPPGRVFDAARALGDADSKFEALCALLDELREAHPDEKVIVFASFRPTLAYLSKRQQERGWAHEVIHGGVPMAPDDREKDERGRRVERFLHDPRCPLLLSSNVGGEGLDLQRAAVVVNYDLPWNPATLEQRIGRVDRFGQQSEVVRVLNLVLPGTVEDIVFGRVYERLQLFETAIGDFAEILGSIVQELSLSFLRRGLSHQELEERARQAALRVEQNQSNLSAVLERERELVAFDDDFAEQLESRRRQAQSVKPEDLQRLVDGVLARRFPRSWLRPSGSGEVGVYEFYVDPDLKQRLQGLLAGNRDSGVVWSFIRAVNEREAVRVTFDGEVAEADPALLLLTSRHPVLQALVRAEADAADFHPVSALRIPRAAGVQAPPGLLVLFDAEFTFGEQKRRYLLPIWMVEGRAADPVLARQLLRTTLDHGERATPTAAPGGDQLCGWLDTAEAVADAELTRTINRIVGREETRIRPRLAQLQERYARRIHDTEDGIAELEAEVGGDEKLAKRLRNKRAYLRRLHRELQEETEKLQRLPEPTWGVDVVGATWLEFGE